MDFPVESLKNWFLLNCRDLPWRHTPSPYGVWVSEVMLQQTQVAVVMGYYENWMRLFPTIRDLAYSPIEVVLKAWEGLGYYSRARNLHEGAKKVVASFGGKIPDNYADLASIKGLGPYTIAAILAFAFKRKIAPIDSNVIRVLCRYFAIDTLIEKKETKLKLLDSVNSFLPDYEPWIIGEALIELGALVCTKKPVCIACPIKKGCLAFRNQSQASFPNKKKRPPTIHLFKHVAVIYCSNKLLIQKGGDEGKVLADLFEFPSLEGPDHFCILQMRAHFEKKYNLSLKEVTILPKERQSYTRYQISLYPYLFACDNAFPPLKGMWKECEELAVYPFSSGHRRILSNLNKEAFTHEKIAHFTH